MLSLLGTRKQTHYPTLKNKARIIIPFLITCLLCLINTIPVQAAPGAKDLEARKAEYQKLYNLNTLQWNNNTARPYLYWYKSGSFGGIDHKNYIHVYAFEGETITFGSNVYDSQLSLDGLHSISENTKYKTEIEDRLGSGATADIILTDLDGYRIPYDVVQNGKGHIPDVQTEILAKTMEKPTGNTSQELKELMGGSVNPQANKKYEPLTYQVRESGIYTFEFHSKTGANNATTDKNAAFGEAGCVAAWDISVFNERGQKKTGRVFADYLDFQENGHQVYETYYAVTGDSYIYKWDFKGAIPNTYNFFTNNRGLIDNATGSTLYKSVKELSNVNFDYTRFGATYVYPGTPPSDISKSFYLFFEEPDVQGLEGTMFSKAKAPDPARNLRFVSQVPADDGSMTSGTYVGSGGWFAFEVDEASTATLKLDFNITLDDIEASFKKFYKADAEVEFNAWKKANQSILPGDGHGKVNFAPVEVTDVVTAHTTNKIHWDGRDGNGIIIPVGVYDLNDIVYTVTTKAGEIHFPIHDVESNNEGFTFTRVNTIYDSDGNVLDDDKSITDDNKYTGDNIYTATRSTIYYDDSAIYYGERVGRTGYDEGEVKVLNKDTAIKNSTTGWYESSNMSPSGANGGSKYAEGLYYGGYQNMLGTGGEKTAYGANYRKKVGSRVGDHSHTTHVIDYSSKTVNPEDKEKIEWLDSSLHPVGKAAGGMNTFDYGISDFWTFVPSEPVMSEGGTETKMSIIDPGEERPFDLTGFVFYDENSNGTYLPQQDMDAPLPDVALTIWKETSDKEAKANKVYAYAKDTDGGKVTKEILNIETGAPISAPEDAKDKIVYEQIRQAKTPITGRQFFENLTYNTHGTHFMYEVTRPDNSWIPTSENTGGKPLSTNNLNKYYNGSYALYAYSHEDKGTEIQLFTIGDNSQKFDAEREPVDPRYNLSLDKDAVTKAEETYEQALKAKEDADSKGPEEQAKAAQELADARQVVWNMWGKTATTIDVGYHYSLYKRLTVSKTWDDENSKDRPGFVAFEVDYAWETEDLIREDGEVVYENGEPLHAGATNIWDVKIISSIMDDTFTYSYLPNTADVDGETKPIKDWFIGAEYYSQNDKIYKHTFNYDKDRYIYKELIADKNLVITDEGLRELGLEKDFDTALIDWDAVAHLDARYWQEDPSTQYHTTIDKDSTDSSVDIIVDNATEPGVIEVYKYTMETGKETALAGATFRLYEGDKVTVQANLEKGDDLSYESGTTRANGRVAFPGIDSNQVYTVREVYPPSGYRMTDEFYEIRPSGNIADTADFYFDNDKAIVKISNVLDDGNMSIRKEIDGRGWMPEDTFTFKVEAAFVDGSTPAEETQLWSLEKPTESPVAASKTFASEWNTQGDRKITISNDSPFALDKSYDSTGHEVSSVSNNLKESVPMILNPDDEAYGTIENAMLTSSIIRDGKGILDNANCKEFPAAGRYELTIEENTPEDTTLVPTGRTFVCTVSVTRVANEPDIHDVRFNNSHLVAEIISIKYTDPEAGIEDYAPYPASVPTFVNNYTVAPTRQKTSYSITKNLVGRDWKDDDRFTVDISGADATTQEALKNGSLYIEGLFGEPDETTGEFAPSKKMIFGKDGVYNPSSMDEEHTDHKVNDGHTFTFDYIDISNITFPSAWVFAEEGPGGAEKGTPVPDYDASSDTNVIVEEEGKYYFKPKGNEETKYEVELKTEDIVYTLNIKEDPEDHPVPSVSYDTNEYKLVFTLKNAPALAGTEFVSDGIVDDMYFALYDSTHEDEPIATCETEQTVKTTFEDWVSGANLEDVYPCYAVTTSDGKTNLREPIKLEKDGEGNITSVVVSAPTSRDPNATRTVTKDNFATEYASCTFFTKTVSHKGDHNMPFTNTYSTQGAWTPKITKVLRGIGWNEVDGFNFKLTYKDGPENITSVFKGSVKPGEEIEQISIDDETSAKDGKEFAGITFTKAGTYNFEIEELPKDKGGFTNHSYDIQVVATDDTLGNLGIVWTTIPEDAGADKTNIEFVNTYHENGQFDLEIQKTLIGRTWSEDDTFTFEVTPDETAKSAIDAGILVLPVDWKADGNSYKFIVGAPGDGNTNTISLGTLSIGNPLLAADGTAWKFNIKEINLEGNIWCPEPEINLTVSPVRKSGAEGLTGEVAITTAWAHLKGDPTENTEANTKTTTLPFENHAYSDATLKVAKDFDGNWSGRRFNIRLTGNGVFPGEIWLGEQKLSSTNPVIPISLDNENHEKELTFKLWQAGDYTFTAQEVINEDDIFTEWDRNTHTITLHVEDTGRGLSAQIFVDETETDTVTFFNKELHPEGGLIVKKIVSDASSDNSAPQDRTFNFKVTLNDTSVEGKHGDVEFAEGLGTFQLVAEDEVIIPNLPTGTTYTVEEIDANDGGFTTQSMGSYGQIPANDDAEATFVNIWKDQTKADVGSIRVSKTLIGEEAPEKKFNFHIELTNSDFTSEETDPKFIEGKSETFNLKTGESKLIENLPANIEYTVIEDNYPAYTTYATGSTGQIVGGAIQDVYFTNTLVKETEPVPEVGSLIVTKELRGPITTKDLNLDFNFKITFTKDGEPLGEDEGVSGLRPDGSYTFSLKAGQSQSFTNFPVGTQYELVETPTENWQSSIPDGETGTIEKDTTIGISVVNTHTDEVETDNTGAIVVAKTVSGNGANLEDTFTFQITLWGDGVSGEYGDLTFESGVPQTFELANGQSKNFTNIPAGTTYEVVEVDSKGYTSTVAFGEAGGVVEDGGSHQVTFNNNKDTLVPEDPAQGNLLVTKTVDGDAAGLADKFKMTVVLSNPEINGFYGNVYFDDGVGTFELGNDESVLIENLPANVHYTVYEDSYMGYIATGKGIEGDIAEGATAVCGWTNTVDTTFNPGKGTVVVRKLVAGEETDKTFHFTLFFKDEVPSEFEEDNGFAAEDGFDLHQNEAKTIIVPEGTEMTVTEDEASREGYITFIGDETAEAATVSVTEGSLAVIEVTNAIPNTALTLTKTHATDGGEHDTAVHEVRIGNIVTYKIQANPEGETPVPGVCITDYVPNGMELVGEPWEGTFIAGSGRHYHVSSDTTTEADGRTSIVWYVQEPIRPSDAVEVQFDAKVPEEGEEWHNTAAATTARADSGKAIFSNEVVDLLYKPKPTPDPTEPDEPGDPVDPNKTGSLTITKVVIGNAPEANKKTYTFTITGPNNYKQTITITGTGQVTIGDLVPGAYTVVESNAEVEGYRWQKSGEATVTVEDGEISAVTVTNSYTSDVNPDDPNKPDKPDEPNDPTDPTDPTEPGDKEPEKTPDTNTNDEPSETTPNNNTTPNWTPNWNFTLPNLGFSIPWPSFSLTSNLTQDTASTDENSDGGLLPRATLPKTGDATNLVIALAVLDAGLIPLGIGAYLLRKGRKKKK